VEVSLGDLRVIDCQPSLSESSNSKDNAYPPALLFNTTSTTINTNANANDSVSEVDGNHNSNDEDQIGARGANSNASSHGRRKPTTMGLILHGRVVNIGSSSATRVVPILRVDASTKPHLVLGDFKVRVLVWTLLVCRHLNVFKVG